MGKFESGVKIAGTTAIQMPQSMALHGLSMETAPKEFCEADHGIPALEPADLLFAASSILPVAYMILGFEWFARLKGGKLLKKIGQLVAALLGSYLRHSPRLCPT